MDQSSSQGNWKRRKTRHGQNLQSFDITLDSVSCGSIQDPRHNQDPENAKDSQRSEPPCDSRYGEADQPAWGSEGGQGDADDYQILHRPGESRFDEAIPYPPSPLTRRNNSLPQTDPVLLLDNLHSIELLRFSGEGWLNFDELEQRIRLVSEDIYIYPVSGNPEARVSAS
ncbi:MAG: hypothetical protein M1814_005979 [Vezdaea aestivalis]|nr:MAG: hypothetical protein M1814_005979 [Vezdaea aestivalis]